HHPTPDHQPPPITISPGAPTRAHPAARATRHSHVRDDPRYSKPPTLHQDPRTPHGTARQRMIRSVIEGVAHQNARTRARTERHRGHPSRRDDCARFGDPGSPSDVAGKLSFDAHRTV